MPEDYVRPPIVAVEPPDPRVVKWRFRAVVALLVALVAVGLGLLAHAIVESGRSNSPATNSAVIWSISAVARPV
jgi:hypothetical protein